MGVVSREEAIRLLAERFPDDPALQRQIAEDPVLSKLKEFAPPAIVKSAFTTVDDGAGGKRVVDTTPIELDIPRTSPANAQGGQLIIPGEQPTEDTEDPEIVQRRRTAASAGVLTNKPSPVKMGHIDAGFAFDEKNRVLAHKNALENHFNQPIDVRMGAHTGEIEYYNPKENRYATVDVPGLSRQDFLGAIPEIATLGTEIAGAVAGGIATSAAGTPVAGVIVGEAAGAYFAEILKHLYAMNRGINLDVPTEEVLQRALASAAIVGSLGMAGEKIVQTGKFMLQTFSGKRAAATALGGSIEQAPFDPTLIQENMDRQAYINSIVEAAGFKGADLDNAQASANATLMAIREVSKKQVGGGLEFFAKQADDQEAAYQNFLNVISQGPDGASLGPTSTGEAVVGIAAGQLERSQTRAAIPVRRAEAAFDDAVDIGKLTPGHAVGAPIRGAVVKRQEAFERWSSAAADALHKLMLTGPLKKNQGKFIDFPLTRETHIKFRNKIKRVKDFFAISQPGLEKITAKSAKEQGQIDRLTNGMGLPADPELLQEVVGRLDAAMENLGPGVLIPGEKIDFRTAWESVSELKRLVREGKTGLTTDPAPVGSLKHLVRKMDEDMRISFKKAEVAEAYTDFTTRYRRFSKELNEGAVARILPDVKGSPQDVEVFKRLFFAGDHDNGKAIHDIVKKYPPAMDAVRAGLRDSYNEAAFPQLKFSTAAHRKWVKDHEHHLKQFFTKPEIEKINRLKTLNEIETGREELRQAALKEMQKMFPAEVASLKPRNIVMALFNKQDEVFPEQLMKMLDDIPGNLPGRVMKILDKTPDIQEAVRHEFKREMRSRIFDKPNGVDKLGPRKLKIFLGDGVSKGFEPHVKAIMGEEYLKKLNILSDALEVAKKEARFPNRSNTGSSLWLIRVLSRVALGPLNPKTRGITAGTQVAERGADRILFHAVMNKDVLDDLINLKNVNINDRRVAAFVAGIGGDAFLDETVKQAEEGFRNVQLPPQLLPEGLKETLIRSLQ